MAASKRRPGNESATPEIGMTREVKLTVRWAELGNL